MKRITLKAALVIAGISILTACGGGSSSGGGSVAGPSLNLKTALTSMITNGSSAAYSLSGDCSGTSVKTSLPAYTGTNYANVSALVVDNLQTDTISASSKAYSACTQIFNSNDGGQIYTDFYSPSTGTIIDEGGTSIWNVYSGQTAAPTSVTAGSTGTLYTYKNYSGAANTSGATTSTGTVTYSVSADTATTLLVTITDTSTKTAANAIQYTASTVYRLNADNTLTPLSFSLATTSAIGSIGAMSVTGTALAAPTLNAGDAYTAQLLAGSVATYMVMDGDQNQCSPSLVITNGALASNPGTTLNGVSYVKSNGTNFNPTTVSGGGDCSNFRLPTSDDSYYGSAYQLLQSTSNNLSGASSSIMASATSVIYPNNVTVGSQGQLNTFNRVGGTSTTPFATGVTTYYVGANTATTLALYEITTKTYTNGQIGRNIFGSQLNANNTLTPKYGALKDGGTFYLLAQ